MCPVSALILLFLLLPSVLLCVQYLVDRSENLVPSVFLFIFGSVCGGGGGRESVRSMHANYILYSLFL